jgi:seryl-tRNA synthetase
MKEAEELEAKKAEMRVVGDRITALDAEVNEVETRLNDLMLRVPNLPDPSVPAGKDDAENVVTRQRRTKDGQDFGFEPPHWTWAALGIIDFERGVKVSGTRFYMLIGAGAKLQRALISFMLDVHIGQGYTEVYPPYLVKREVLVGTGQLPKFAENQYYDQIDDLWMIPRRKCPANMYAARW